MPSYAFHVYAGVPQAEPTRQAATRPAKVYAKAPAWIEAAVSDLKRPLTPAGSGETGSSFPPEDELPIVAALEKALGMPVKAVQGTSAAPAGTRGLILRLTMDPKTDSSWWLGMQHCRQGTALVIRTHGLPCSCVFVMAWQCFNPLS